MTFLGDRIGETITGETAPVVVNVYGDDLDVLDAKAKEIKAVLQKVARRADVQVKSPPGAPRVAVRLEPEKLMQFGFRPVEMLEAMQTAYQGTVVAQTYHGNRVADIAVILDENRPERTRKHRALSCCGTLRACACRLSEMADVYLTSGRHSILHEGARRRQTMTCSAEGRDVYLVCEGREKADRAKIEFPGGSYMPYSAAAAEAQAKAQQQLLLHSGIAAVGNSCCCS